MIDQINMKETQAQAIQLPEVRRFTLSEQAFESILNLIEQGVLRPGDRLPPQRQLCAQMSLSQTAVREALRGLASIGVIEIQPGRGTFVSRIRPDLLVRPEALFGILERETLLQALEVRRILEVEAIALAAQRATEGDLREIETELRQIQMGLKSDDKALLHSPKFHLAIAKATHNEVLGDIIKPFLRIMARGAQVIAEKVPEAKEREYGLHVELYEAILTRDPEEARKRMRLHLDEAEKLIIEGYSAIQSTSLTTSGE